MEQNKLNISTDQAKVFARAIYTNISAYIQDHQEEYQKFLLEEENADEKN
ncbi:MAG: hypothetical protein RR444_06030 [Oscillospiraceae bacterium]